MKKTICTMAAILLFGMGAAQADNQMGRWLSSNDPTVKTITTLEDMWAHTACSSVPSALKAAFAEDFQGTFPNGQRYGRPTNWGGEGDNIDCQLQQIQIRLFGDSVAVAYGNESSVSKKQGGADLKHCLAWTDTWLKRNGKWQIIAAQDNVIACK
ncbi:MAG TPA: nuclear transport factor 2 family protein [Gammaproteobacteria bacterium]|nr:nuclear transport factor 2 family protein [Gammaproteobacteria bacterium]